MKCHVKLRLPISDHIVVFYWIDNNSNIIATKGSHITCSTSSICLFILHSHSSNLTRFSQLNFLTNADIIIYHTGWQFHIVNLNEIAGNHSVFVFKLFVRLKSRNSVCCSFFFILVCRQQMNRSHTTGHHSCIIL